MAGCQILQEKIIFLMITGITLDFKKQLQKLKINIYNKKSGIEKHILERN